MIVCRCRCRCYYYEMVITARTIFIRNPHHTLLSIRKNHSIFASSCHRIHWSPFILLFHSSYHRILRSDFPSLVYVIRAENWNLWTSTTNTNETPHMYTHDSDRNVTQKENVIKPMPKANIKWYKFGFGFVYQTMAWDHMSLTKNFGFYSMNIEKQCT